MSAIFVFETVYIIAYYPRIWLIVLIPHYLSISVASYGMQEKRDLHYLLLNGRRIEKR